MASFCYVCGTATPAGLNRETGEIVATTTRSGIGPVDLLRKLQRALGPSYELQERIGAGGFAEVFRARDLRLKRDLAVKVLRPDLGLSPELLQRFRREAETIATLRNAHIVPVYDIGEAEGLAFIIMPMIAGESLRAVLDRDGAMDPAEVRRILSEAALGLGAAHDAGVIHRDIKPENIMLEGRDKRVLLMDFGISKAVGAASDGDPSATLTTTGIIIGTPQYMSPEQACGDKTIDARSDQYSLAVVGYRMLAGGLPFEGESTRAVLYQQLVAEPPPLATKVANLPSGLATAIQRAMAKEPAERFANMLEFAAMLGTDSIEAGVASGAPHRGLNRTRVFVVALAAVVLFFVGDLWITSRNKVPVIPATTVAAVTPAAPLDSSAALTKPSPSPAAAVPPPPAAPGARGSKLGGATTPSAGANKNGSPSGAAGSTALGATAPGSPGGANAATNAANTASCAKLAAAATWPAAATQCTKEATAGNAAAERILGTMYENGTGVSQSATDAVTWYRKAAATDVEAQFLLSHILEIGPASVRNDDESLIFLREAAAGGWLRAQQTLAYRLESGSGIKKNETEAALWYRKAAERGDPLSEEKLGEFLAKGRGTDKNETEALTWFTKAGDAGSGEAAWQASQLYFKGHGVAKSDSAGMEWLKKAAALKQADAEKELKKRTGQ
jgi:serine/threonine-protein kinase